MLTPATERVKMSITIDTEFKAAIPDLWPEERKQLEENILQYGCRDPLVTWNGTLIDGHNRYSICQEHGLDYKIVEIDLPDREAALDWIDANQLGRRNLTPDAFRLLIGRRYNRMKKAVNDGGKGTTKTVPQNEERLSTAEKLANEHGVSRATVERAGEFAREVEETPELQEAINHREPVSKVKREIKREQKAQALAEIENDLPDKKYRVIYADPPWDYGDKRTGLNAYSAAADHYPSMSIKELCDLPVKDLAMDDAVLFMWTTSPLLFECAPIIEAWGFKYKASFVWDKVAHNVGHYNSVRHEFLLICTRGSCTRDCSELFDSVVSIDRTGHSSKPERFREIIDTMYQHGQRIELFRRGSAPGDWDIWGNEANEDA